MAKAISHTRKRLFKKRDLKAVQNIRIPSALQGTFHWIIPRLWGLLRLHNSNTKEVFFEYSFLNYGLMMYSQLLNYQLFCWKIPSQLYWLVHSPPQGMAFAEIPLQPHSPSSLFIFELVCHFFLVSSMKVGDQLLFYFCLHSVGWSHVGPLYCSYTLFLLTLLCQPGWWMSLFLCLPEPGHGLICLGVLAVCHNFTVAFGFISIALKSL